MECLKFTRKKRKKLRDLSTGSRRSLQGINPFQNQEDPRCPMKNKVEPIDEAGQFPLGEHLQFLPYVRRSEGGQTKGEASNDE
jgi:hypothetical protein